MMEEVLEKMAIEKYSAYKDSGVEWLGEIPEGWECFPLKRIIIRNDGGVWNENFSDNGILVYRSTEINIDGSWNDCMPISLLLNENEICKAKLEFGDLIVTKSSGSPEHIGKTAIINEKQAVGIACYSNFMQRIRLNLKKQDSKFYYYILNSIISRNQYKVLTKSTSGLGNLNGEILGNILTVNPPLFEQTTIANFLDHKTALIDKAISIKEKQIELLKERRQILIYNAVTRGLNLNVKMKDSGVEWIGEIPENWEVKRLKYVVKILKRIIGYEGPVVLSITQRGIKVKDIESGEGQLAMNFRNTKLYLRENLR